VARARLGAELARLHADRLRDPTAARDAQREARRALAGQPPPLTLLEVEASLHLRQGNPEQALSTARAGQSDATPVHSADRRAWLGLRAIEARALVASDRIGAALDRLRDLPPDCTRTERERLTVEAAVLAWKAGQFDSAARSFAAAARIDPDTAGVDQVRWMDRAATARYHAGDRGAAAEIWEGALQLARAAGAPTERTRIEATLCSVLREACRFEESARHGQRAYDRGLNCGAFQHATNAALAMADLRMVTGATDDAAAWLGRAGRLVERQRLQRARGRLARRWAELAVRREDPRAMDTVTEALRTVQRSELVRDAARVTALKAVLLAREDRTEQLTATLKRAMEPLITQGATRTLAEVRLWAAQAQLEAGQPQRAIEEAAHAVVWADEVGHQLFRNRGDDLTARARAQQRKGAPEGGTTDLERLLEVGVALGRERDLSAVLDQIARAAMHLVEADRAFVVLAEDGGGHRVAAAHSRDGASPGRPSSSVVQTALSRGREVIVSNVEERGDLRAQDSIVHLRLRSAWCLPLIEGDRTLGVIYADSQIVTQGELSRATRLLRALAGPAAVAVTNARLLAESARRAEQAADIAHDIRSPLASVAMAAEHLQTLTELPDWTLETLGLMESQVRRVMDMAHRFLEDRPSQPRTFDLAQRAERLASIAARDARHRGRTVTFEAGGRAVIHAAPDDLDRAITNLLSNALQHTPEGTTVEVRVDVDDREARLTVRDHGPGVPADLLPRLFERGVRSSDTGGFGLGLSIARRIVGDAGGALSADSHPQGGARFQARLPLHAPRVALDTLT
jgi:signal transduction histidine kinase/tetratricopeptide (TPR) repeat protein